MNPAGLAAKLADLNPKDTERFDQWDSVDGFVQAFPKIIAQVVGGDRLASPVVRRSDLIISTQCNFPFMVTAVCIKVVIEMK